MLRPWTIDKQDNSCDRQLCRINIYRCNCPVKICYSYSSAFVTNWVKQDVNDLQLGLLFSNWKLIPSLIRKLIFPVIWTSFEFANRWLLHITVILKTYYGHLDLHMLCSYGHPWQFLKMLRTMKQRIDIWNYEHNLVRRVHFLKHGIQKCEHSPLKRWNK